MGTARELEAGGDEPTLALAYVGSPENGFSDAGRLVRLAGARHVVFTRGEDGQIAERPTPQGLCVEVPLPYVSSRHAELSLSVSGDRSHRIRDRGSRNGTHVEGQPVRADAAVRPGQIFEIGRSFWAVVELSGLDEDEGIAALSEEGSASSQMRHVLSALSRLAPSQLPLLITGETGVGKDRLAHAVHRASGRAGELVHANAVSTAFAQLAVDTEDEPGLLTRAIGGTLYVDEVGELGTDAQTKLLSALMSHGGDDVRLIAASTRDLRGMAAVDGFRSDLLARLAGFEAFVPPLRERREDLGILTRTLCRRADGTPVSMTTSVFRSMLAHSWPFNVRELENTLVAAAALAGDDPQGITLPVWRTVCNVDQPSRDPGRIQAVREALVQHLVQHRGDTRKVAASMHCELDDVQRWLDQLDLRPEAFVGRAG